MSTGRPVSPSLLAEGQGTERRGPFRKRPIWLRSQKTWMLSPASSVSRTSMQVTTLVSGDLGEGLPGGRGRGGREGSWGGAEGRRPQQRILSSRLGVSPETSFLLWQNCTGRNKWGRAGVISW